MKTEKYQVDIPKILADLMGPQTLRVEITTVVCRIFENWAREDLLNRIRVTKPRKEKEAAE